MSIQSEIDRISTNIQDSISAVASMGGAVDPESTYTSDELPGLIGTIPAGVPVPEPYPVPVLPTNMAELVFEEYQGYEMVRYSSSSTNMKVNNTGDNTQYIYVAPVRNTQGFVSPDPTHGGYAFFYCGNVLLKIAFFPWNPIGASTTWQSYGGIVENSTDMASDTSNQVSGWRFVQNPNRAGRYLVIQKVDNSALSISEGYFAPTEPYVYIDTTDGETEIQTYGDSVPPAYETVTKNITSNGTKTYTPSYGYSAIKQLTITTNVTPTINTKFVTISGASASANSSKVYDLGTDISNTHPFVLTLLGGSYGTQSYATYETCIKYNGSGTFTVTQSDTGTYATTVNASRCSIDADGKLTVYFTKAYYPWGTSSSSATRKAVLTYV